MKSISKTFSQLKFNKLEKCNPKPGYKDSCEGCKNCKKGKGLVYEEVDGRCCYMPAPNFGTIYSTTDFAESINVQFKDITCATVFECKFETTGHWDDNQQLVRLLTPDVGIYGLTRNQWFSFNVAPGDFVQFNFQNNLAGFKCVTIHLKNQDCNINYGTVGTLCTYD